MITKKCFKCKRIKKISLFYRHKLMPDGYLGKCIKCAKKDVKDRYYNPEFRKRIQEYEKKRSQSIERKKKVAAYVIKRREKSPGKVRAQRKASNAIRDGRLKRLPCEVCGNVKSEAHHDDYRRYLDVRWLCFKHHREAHNQILF